MRKEAQAMALAALRQKEDKIKENTSKIVAKYEDALEQLGKENKRLQTSLKDMVSTNRSLRDQVFSRSNARTKRFRQMQKRRKLNWRS